MALIKRKTRRKLSKQLAKIVKKHGPEITLALVSGIISGLSDEDAQKPRRGRAVVEPLVVKPPLRTSAARKRSTL